MPYFDPQLIQSFKRDVEFRHLKQYTKVEEFKNYANTKIIDIGTVVDPKYDRIIKLTPLWTEKHSYNHIHTIIKRFNLFKQLKLQNHITKNGI